ncbi:MAG: glutaredoxin domain-containing protein [Prochlorococcaceae cyanobacterium]
MRLYRLDSPQHHGPYGERARQLLVQHGIPFQDHRLTSQEEAERFKASWGVASTPQVYAGSERIGGASELETRLGRWARAGVASWAWR